jgi:hypothetical protein
MTPEQEQIRAGQAREWLENPMFKEAREKIEAGLAAQRRKVPMRETDMHTRLILTEQLWANLISYLQESVDTGKFAQFEVERQKRRMGVF